MSSFPTPMNNSRLRGLWPWGARGARDEGAADGAGDGRGEEEAKARKDESASWNFEAGSQLVEGRSVLKRLGGGSRYEVYLVWDERLFAITVAKVLRPDQAEDAHALAELRREAGVLDRLAHPCLVRGFGAALEGPRPHVLLEHLEGPTLRRLIKQQGTVPLEQLLPLALHVAAVLQYMANEGFVHLDVKPSNIVMGVPPRLIDLSIAQTIESAARMRHSMGTDLYMPPEQCDPAAHAGQVGPPADVWGLGATLYHAVTGETPFPRGERESGDRAARFPQLVAGMRPLPEGVPGPLRDLIEGMLAREPGARPSAAEVATALEPLVATIVPRLRATRRGVRAW